MYNFLKKLIVYNLGIWIEYTHIKVNILDIVLLMFLYIFLHIFLHTFILVYLTVFYSYYNQFEDGFDRPNKSFLIGMRQKKSRLLKAESQAYKIPKLCKRHTQTHTHTHT